MVQASLSELLTENDILRAKVSSPSFKRLLAFQVDRHSLARLLASALQVFQTTTP